MARLQQEKQAAVTTGGPNNRPSLRNGLNGLYALSSGTGLIAPVALRIIRRKASPRHREVGTTRFHRRIDLFVRMM
jgi:hypothetical protein